MSWGIVACRPTHIARIQARSVPSRSALLADHEAGHVEQIDDRDMEFVAQLEEMSLIIGAVVVARAAVLTQIIRHDAARQAVDSGESANHRRTPVRLQLEEIATV